MGVAVDAHDPVAKQAAANGKLPLSASALAHALAQMVLLLAQLARTNAKTYAPRNNQLHHTNRVFLDELRNARCASHGKRLAKTAGPRHNLH